MHFQDSKTLPIAPNLSQRIKRVQKEVHHTLGIMEKATSKLLNYRQFLHHPDYHADWAKSSANEFVRLANRVSGRIKGTQTIKFIRKHDIPKIATKTSPTANLSAKSTLKRRNPNALGSSLAAIESTIPAKLPHPPLTWLWPKSSSTASSPQQVPIS
eukprot:CCRYP_008711-RA/>CCRYP_008711-RA protein AED:0.40 eAED:0.40 QI:0/-1/0/1/-1/1/1/0/156